MSVEAKDIEQAPGKGAAIVIVTNTRTNQELHRETVAADEVGAAIARLVREREDAQGA